MNTDEADAPALLTLDGVTRTYRSGDETVTVLRSVDLAIAAGEMVAIIGASGSGKSTLMNILGCLDRPSSGHYRIAGRDVAQLSTDERADLRRAHFGFVFQRYNLLAELTALGNVEMPAIYAGEPPRPRLARAATLLGRLGMAPRLTHRPGQLSGGQQQRVSIARALMNDAEVILADEPTGALDRQSGEEVLRILDELNAEGRTVVLVTHDPAVAARASRIIEIDDGRIVGDRRTAPLRPRLSPPADRTAVARPGWRQRLDLLREAFRMAVTSMNAHRLRTGLTMLGIVIGVASVVCVVALGEGSRQKVLANISALGTNTIEIFAGKDFGDTRSGKITTLVVADAEQLARQPYVAAATPTVSTQTTVRFGGKEANALVNGVSEHYFAAKGTTLARGRFFDASAIAERALDAVIDENTRKTLFDGTGVEPIGAVLLIGNVPARIVGVTRPQQGGFGSSQNLSLYLPYTAVQSRILGSNALRSITLKVKDDVETAYAAQAVTQFLTQRHGSKDFFILNTDDIRRTITSTTQALTLLIAAIAVISLLVGGIGVMNIMLVSVSERIGEIGVRMAVGARPSDILQQFLTEAVMVCLLGGAVGVGLALAFGLAFAMAGPAFPLIYSSGAILLALTCSSLIGIAFGYLPARNAARLDPVAALSNSRQ
ncbi:MacB family efflux pump subunit [Ancylobacter sp. IITR112]|uniref:MacB family efflux pump subunit n=1 Tax=Ancylobacter sp. IITR112 TaxID=3138073 RepID=UPI00352AD2F5